MTVKKTPLIPIIRDLEKELWVEKEGSSNNHVPVITKNNGEYVLDNEDLDDFYKSVENIGKVKVNDEDQTFGYLDDKIEVSFPIKKAYLAGNDKKIYIQAAEKIALGRFAAKWSNESYDKRDYDTRAVIVGRISNDTTELSGVNFCVTHANPATFKIEYANLSGSARTLNLYVTTDISDWSDAGLFTVELETTSDDSIKTAEVDIDGMGDYPLYFLLVSDEYGEEVEGITIFDIYKY